MLTFVMHTVLLDYLSLAHVAGYLAGGPVDLHPLRWSSTLNRGKRLEHLGFDTSHRINNNNTTVSTASWHFIISTTQRGYSTLIFHFMRDVLTLPLFPLFRDFWIHDFLFIYRTTVDLGFVTQQHSSLARLPLKSPTVTKGSYSA